MGKTLMRRLKQTKPFADPSHEALVNLLLAGAWAYKALDLALEPHGLTHAQYNVLRILRGAHPGGQPRCEIAARLIDRAPDVTRLIDRLTRAKLVERSRGEADRRQAVTRITAKGLKALDGADVAVEEVHRMLTTRLGVQGCEGLSGYCEAVYGDGSDA